VSDTHVHLQSRLAVPLIGSELEEPNWFAIHTMARHEKRVDSQLKDKRATTFLPLLQQVHRWSDRRTTVQVPLFSCYVFVRIVPTVEKRIRILQTPGVLGFVGSERQGTPIPDE